MAQTKMNDRLRDLVEGMMHPNVVGTSVADSVSARAYREIESAADPALLRAALETVVLEKDKERRRALYFIIFKLAVNLKNQEACPFLIRQLERESDKYVLMFLLDWIADLPKPKGTDLTPIFRHLDDKRWQVRHSAIGAFKHTESPIAEQSLINILQTTSDPFDLVYANATLNYIGTAKAIPAIEQHLKSRKLDVKMTAQCAINEIQKREALGRCHQQ